MSTLNINGKTSFLVILGDPVAHSLSPAMQNAALQHLRLNAVYLPCRVNSTELTQAVSGLRALNFIGANVTIPHKQAVVALVDELLGDASQSGSVNTLIHRGGKLYGASTDGIGLISSLREAGEFEPRGKKVLIFGAGGTAVAAGYALVASQISSLTIVNRNLQKAEFLQNKLFQATGFKAEVVQLTELETIVWSEIDLILNSTSVGLESEISILPVQYLQSHHFVYDLVYRTNGTKLCREAEAAGCRVLSGLSLLLYQGVESFRLWFEQDPPIKIMKQVLLEKV